MVKQLMEDFKELDELEEGDRPAVPEFAKALFR